MDMTNEHNPDLTYLYDSESPLSGKAVGLRIRDARKSMYLTQSELAKLLGVSTSYVSFLEKGTRPITHSILGPLLRCLNISYDYLIMGKYPDDIGFISSVCETSSYEERLKLEHLLEKCTKSEYEMCYKLCRAYLETSRYSRETTASKPKSK